MQVDAAKLLLNLEVVHHDKLLCCFELKIAYAQCHEDGNVVQRRATLKRTQLRVLSRSSKCFITLTIIDLIHQHYEI